MTSFEKKTFIMDIDGTICTNTFGEYVNAVPFYDRIEAINKLHKMGHSIIYFTARGMGRTNNDAKEASRRFFDFTFDQLVSWGCFFDSLRLGKPAGSYYIDDKAMTDIDFFEHFIKEHIDGK